MKTISAFWIPSPDEKYTNFGDILTPYILNKFDIIVVDRLGEILTGYYNWTFSLIID